ncbi:MAG: helix-turn-helix transcriptional regulator [Streptosporangiaceae bacterium]
MPRNASPEVRRRRLAAELRRLRAESRLKTTEVAERLGWSPSKVSRYELARTGFKLSDVRQMLTFYRVETKRQKELLALAKEASERGWWEDFSDVLPEEHISLIGLEDEATAEWTWHLEVMPGLLQTEEYARHVNSKGYSLAPVPPGQIERSVEVRMKRQELLTRDPPLALSVVIDEAVLRRRVGGPDVMRRQLNHLIAVAQLPNVSLRVLLLEDETPMLISSFNLLRFGDQAARMPDVVYTEHFRATLYFEGESDTYQYRIVFQRLQEGALDGSESLDFIGQVMRQI